MNSDRLSRAYLEKGKLRLEVLEFMHRRGGYSDVVREAQELVELLLKAVLRSIGVEAPKVHDVSRALAAVKAKLPGVIVDNLDEIADISRSLRKDRELSFYGTEDWIPTEEYDQSDSEEAISKARKVLEWVAQALA